VTLSRTEVRSIALTQELGLMRERLDRIAGDLPAARPLADTKPQSETDVPHDRT
jgi:hypothetical protein